MQVSRVGGDKGGTGTPFLRDAAMVAAWAEAMSGLLKQNQSYQKPRVGSGKVVGQTE